MTSGLLERRELADERLVDKIAADISCNVNGRCLKNEPLSNHTSFKVGGPASLYVYPADKEALAALLKLCRSRSLDVLIIGYGSNLLVSDDGFPGCVIDLVDAFREVRKDDDSIVAGAGALLNDVVQLTADYGFTGLEGLAGIPGGVGGGMSMNCGAFGVHISDHLVELEVMDFQGTVKNLLKSDIEFGYRSALGLAGQIVLRAVFQPGKDKPASIRKKIEETIAERHRRNVMSLPSAGSVFRNPSGHFAAQLLESVGAKGMRVGGAEVSSHHANFIINTRGGSAGDIVELIGRLRGIVHERYGIDLKLELRTVGFDNVLEI